MNCHRIDRDSVVRAFFTGVILLAGVATAAPPEVASEGGASVRPEEVPIPDMTNEELVFELERLQVEATALAESARWDVSKRLHRMGYEKYRSVEAKLERVVLVLAESRAREGDLHQRIRIGRRIDQIQTEIAGVRRMIDLLRVFVQG